MPKETKFIENEMTCTLLNKGQLGYQEAYIISVKLVSGKKIFSTDFLRIFIYKKVDNVKMDNLYTIIKRIACKIQNKYKNMMPYEKSKKLMAKLYRIKGYNSKSKELSKVFGDKNQTDNDYCDALKHFKHINMIFLIDFTYGLPTWYLISILTSYEKNTEFKATEHNKYVDTYMKYIYEKYVPKGNNIRYSLFEKA